MRRVGRLLPRDAAESVAVFVAAVLVAGAAVSAHDPDPSVREATTSGQAVVVAGGQRAGTAEVTPHAPSSPVSVLGRVPVSTRAPLAGTGAGTAAASGTHAPRATGSATADEVPGPWLGVTPSGGDVPAAAGSATPATTSTTSTAATTSTTAPTSATTTATATSRPSPSTSSAPSPSTPTTASPSPSDPPSPPPTPTSPPPTSEPTAAPTTPGTPTPTSTTTTTSADASPSGTTGDSLSTQDRTPVPAPTVTAP